MASATAATTHNVFVYGSLLADEVVLFGITDPELHILDEFEDVEYQRTPVEVSLLESCNNKQLQAHAYVWSDSNDPNLYGDWDFEEWERVHKEDFIKMTAGFVEELELPESKPRVATYESFYNQQDAEK
ncbi:AIG2-like protein [Corchorus capsularis]|uniref:Putative gamma-glutamylcyclotransferase n=1 Tax=Corchorus capsularis TaxID=210143 RepID=A0A1R3GV31_COCAP|nr:AIG2-like protein [Corchorus capsularis]